MKNVTLKVVQRDLVYRTPYLLGTPAMQVAAPARRAGRGSIPGLRPRPRREGGAGTALREDGTASSGLGFSGLFFFLDEMNCIKWAW